MSEEKKTIVKDLDVGVKLQVAIPEDGDERHALVEVNVNIPHFFGDRDMVLMVVPRSLFVLPGVSEIIRKSIPDIVACFVRSTGAGIHSTEIKAPEKFKVPPFPGEIPN